MLNRPEVAVLKQQNSKAPFYQSANKEGRKRHPFGAPGGELVRKYLLAQIELAALLTDHLSGDTGVTSVEEWLCRVGRGHAGPDNIPNTNASTRFSAMMTVFYCNEWNKNTITRTCISDSGETSFTQRHKKDQITGSETLQNKYKMQPKQQQILENTPGIKLNTLKMTNIIDKKKRKPSNNNNNQNKSQHIYRTIIFSMNLAFLNSQWKLQFSK